MKNIFLMTMMVMSMGWAKVPAYPDSFTCPQKTKKSDKKKPVLLHEVNEKHILGLCGVKEAQNGNYSDFDVYVFPKDKKPIFSNHLKDRRFLVMEKKDGIFFIEKVKVDKEYVELFKREINCTEEKCVLEKEVCIAINKVKQQWIFKNIKDSKVKSRMKKLGCV